MKRLAVIAVLVCCGKAAPMDADTHPFQLPPWTTAPTDDEIVAAIVGSDGSQEHRAEVEQIARDLLLPRLRAKAGSDLAAIKRWLAYRKERYEAGRQVALDGAFLRSAVGDELDAIEVRATELAMARLHAELFPSEHVPEDWGDVPELPIADIDREATRLAQRLEDIERRYGPRLPGAFGTKLPDLTSPVVDTYESVRVARNSIHIARTGDYRIASAPIYRELSRRRLDVRPLNEHPY